MSKIYTKTGDKGETTLLGGKRVSKDCLVLEVIGEIDELNSTIGEAAAYHHGDESLFLFLQSIQRDLFKAGAEIASAQSGDRAADGHRFEVITESHVESLEKKIDELGAKMPELKQFILPGGSVAGAHLHHARTVSRRVERALVAFGRNTAVRPELHKYFNRLSDFLFTAARWVNFKEGAEEVRV